MTEIYVEYAIIDNMVMDYLLLRQAAVATATPYKKRRVLLASALGTFFALVLPLIGAPKVVEFLSKLALGGVIAFLAVRHRGVREYVRYFNVFLLFTFLLGGGIFAFLSIAGIKCESGAYIKSGVLPVGVTLAAGAALVLGVKIFINKALSVVKSYGDVTTITVRAEGKLFEFSAFFDSGNTVEESRSGLPVVFLSRSALNKIFLKIKPVSVGKVYFSTATGYTSAEAYRVEYVIVAGRKEKRNAVIALCSTTSSSMPADAIIGKRIFI